MIGQLLWQNAPRARVRMVVGSIVNGAGTGGKLRDLLPTRDGWRREGVQ